MGSRIVLVTGASSGIGRATALKFAANDATVIASSRTVEGGKKIEEELASYSNDSIWYQTDIMKPSSIENLFQQITNNFGSLDIAFNNAASGSSWKKKLHELHLRNFEDTLQGTLSQVFQCMKEEIRIMLGNEGGSIINNSSVDGLRGFDLDIAYSTAKHGVIGLTKSAAQQYATDKIRINAIAPGWISTPPVLNYIENDKTAREKILSHQPMKRLGDPEEVANLVYFLASSEASFMTGSVVTIDGGYTTI